MPRWLISSTTAWQNTYSRTPEIETADLSQSQASPNFGLIVYFLEIQVQQPTIIETCIQCAKLLKKILKLPCDTFIIDKK